MPTPCEPARVRAHHLGDRKVEVVGHRIAHGGTDYRR
jgi:acetate kinase